MRALDPYHVTDKLEETVLEAIVTRLEARDKYPFFQHVLAEYLDAMSIDAAATVLDMGCGTGIAARTIARRPHLVGTVMGIDLSPYLAQTAARLAAAEGLGKRMTFRTGDTRRLDCSEGTFDAVVAHTLVSHVDDLRVVLQEAARVVKPGGVVGLFAGDYASMTFTLQ